MANKNFNQFVQLSAVSPSVDRLVGYSSPTANGERSWPASVFYVPTGSIISFGGQTAPEGWIPCDGRSTESYPALAAVVGTNVPDLRGYFVRGSGTNSDGTSSGTFGAKQADSFKAHSHVYTDRFLGGNIGSGSNSYTGSGKLNGGYSENRSSETVGGDETRPKNIALLYIIKT